MKQFNRLSHVVLLVVCSAVIALGQSSATKTSSNSGKLTPQQFNALVSQEATQNSVTYLVSQLGGSLSGTWTGTITASEWELTFSGSVNGQTATIREIGVLKGKVADWKDSGTVGTTEFSGSGKATLSTRGIKWDQVDSCPPCNPWYGETLQVFTEFSNSQCQCETEIAMDSQFAKDQNAPSSSGFFVSTAINLETGTTFGSSVQATQQFTTIQEGSIDFSTGAISYNIDTFSPQG
jgi:hypothetical protein